MRTLLHRLATRASADSSTSSSTSSSTPGGDGITCSACNMRFSTFTQLRTHVDNVAGDRNHPLPARY